MADGKKLFSALVERVAADPTLRKQLKDMDVDQFCVLLKENGAPELAREEAQKLLARLQAAFTGENGELSDEALNAAAGGFLTYCGTSDGSPGDGSGGGSGGC